MLWLYALPLKIWSNILPSWSETKFRPRRARGKVDHLIWFLVYSKFLHIAVWSTGNSLPPLQWVMHCSPNELSIEGQKYGENSEFYPFKSSFSQHMPVTELVGIYRVIKQTYYFQTTQITRSLHGNLILCVLKSSSFTTFSAVYTAKYNWIALLQWKIRHKCLEIM